LCLNAGIYTQAIRLDRSGTATAPITIESTPGRRAILDGSGLSLGARTSIVGIYGSYIHVTDIEVQHSSGRGITIFGNNDTVSYSKFHDMQFNALIASGSNDLILGNEVYDTVMSNVNDAYGSGGWAEAMNSFQSTNVTFRNNYIHDNWGEGINFIESTGSVADGNTVVNDFSVLIYNGNSKNSTITRNFVATTDSTHSRSGSQSGVLLSEESCVQGDSNVTISDNTIWGGTIGVGYWWTGCGGASDSYERVTITNNAITARSAIHFDTVGGSSPAPFGNRLAKNTVSGRISIGQRSAWTFT
jgi:parallel beta-helix repeat protein